MRRGTVRDIDLVERRAVVWYAVGNEIRTFDGWVRKSLDGGTVEARNYKGRNRWNLASVGDVLQVNLIQEGGE